MVDKDVPCAVVFQVGDLEAAGVADLSWLEGGIEGLDLHHRLGVPGLWRRKTRANKQGRSQSLVSLLLFTEVRCFATANALLKIGRVNLTYILLVEVFQRSLPLRQDELSAEELTVVSSSFP